MVTRDEAILQDVRYGFPLEIEVKTATDSEDAEKVLEGFSPSVVIVDLKTGRSGGYALARTMSEMPVLRDVPIMILLERDQDAWLAKQAGARLHRTKPISAEMLARDALSLVG